MSGGAGTGRARSLDLAWLAGVSCAIFAGILPPALAPAQVPSQGAASTTAGSPKAAASGSQATGVQAVVPRSHAAVRKPAPVVPAATSARATLHVTPGAFGTPWTFEVTNVDTTPLRLVMDGRILSLDVTPASDEATGDPDGKSAGTRAKAVARQARVAHCALPSDVRPTTDDDRPRVIFPGITYVAEFDPRLYCFDGRDAAALVPGARVVGHLGWAAHGASNTQPFVVDAVDQTSAEDARSGVKELTAEAVVVPDPIAGVEAGTRRERLVLTAPARVDAESAQDLVVDVTVENPTSRALRVMLRPETLAFEVASPRGVHQCAWRARTGAPIAEVFTTVGAHGKASTNVLLAALCPENTFQNAGLYTIEASLDTRHASGRSIGIDSFDGYVHAATPTLVRVRHGRGPGS